MTFPFSNRVKSALIAATLCVAIPMPAFASDEPAPSPGMMQQALLSEELIALGMERNDPILMLAALRLRATLDDTTVSAGGAFTDKKTVIAAAKKAAAGQDQLLMLIEDAEIEKGRLFCYPSWGRKICY